MNDGVIDRWTAVHALTGVAAGCAGMRPVTALGIAVVYEIAEHEHEAPNGSVFFGSKRPESVLNVASDLAIFAAGYFAGRRHKSKRTAAVATLGAAALTFAFTR